MHSLRKATPDMSGGWHQDKSASEDVRSINVWFQGCHAAATSPRAWTSSLVRPEEFVETEQGTYLDFQISDATPPSPWRISGQPIFNPGDALLFDHIFLHQTGSDPSMPNPRYAIESWFFGPSSYPRITCRSLSEPHDLQSQEEGEVGRRPPRPDR